MIIKEYGKYTLYCDGCDETLIKGVSWRDIKALKDTFAFESRNPRVEILIRELEVEE